MCSLMLLKRKHVQRVQGGFFGIWFVLSAAASSAIVANSSCYMQELFVTSCNKWLLSNRKTNFQGIVSGVSFLCISHTVLCPVLPTRIKVHFFLVKISKLVMQQTDNTYTQTTTALTISFEGNSIKTNINIYIKKYILKYGLVQFVQ